MPEPTNILLRTPQGIAAAIAAAQAQGDLKAAELLGYASHGDIGVIMIPTDDRAATVAVLNPCENPPQLTLIDDHCGRGPAAWPLLARLSQQVATMIFARTMTPMDCELGVMLACGAGAAILIETTAARLKAWKDAIKPITPFVFEADGGVSLGDERP